MNARWLCALLLGALVISPARAQTGVLDQVSPVQAKTTFNGNAPALIWQAQVRSGVAGTLEGITLELFSPAGGSQLDVRIRVGPGWNTSPVVFQTQVSASTAGWQSVFVDCSAANIAQSVGGLFVIEMQGNGTGTFMGGSYIDPSIGPPLYPEPMFLDGPGCFAGCGWRIAFKTHVLPNNVSTYCTAKLNSLGCLPAIGALGLPVASATSGFVVRAQNVRNQSAGVLLYGNTGRLNQPFSGGTLCLRTPFRRAPAANAGGSSLPAADCSGAFSVDLSSYGHGLLGGAPAPFLLIPGSVVNCQWWGRDVGYPAPNNTTLTDALEFTIQ